MEPAKKKNHKMKKKQQNGPEDCELEESSKSEVEEFSEPKMISAKDFLKSVLATTGVLPKESLNLFLDQVAEYNKGPSKYDIVADYLKLSGTCSELLELLTRSQIRARDNVPLFAVLEKILLSIAGELHAYENIGQTIVKAILQSGMKAIDSILCMKEKSGNIKLVFKLLTSMVAQGVTSAKDVMASFDFQKEGLLKLINLRNSQDSHDVRVCFLHFIISFLIAGDNVVIQKLLEEKGFLNAAFPGLPCDDVSIISLFLTTMKEKVLENPGISKTLKIRVLNDSTLKYVFQLLKWIGPKYRIGMKKRNYDKKIEKKFVEQEAAEDDVVLVRDISTNFLHVACCSFKFGIIFHDWTLGTSGKNRNHVITNLLASVHQPYTNKHLSELICEILKSCPDQVHPFLKSIHSALEPRLSPVWFQAMDFVNKIMTSQDPVEMILMSAEKKTPKRFVELFFRLCSPVFQRENLEHGLQGNVLEIQHRLMSHMATVLEKVNLTVHTLEKSPPGMNCSSIELAGFIMALQEAVFKILPDSKVIFECLHNVVTPSMELETLVPGLPVVSIGDYLEMGFHLLAMCRRVFPLNFSDFSVSNDVLLGIVKSRAQLLSSEETEKLHLKILHILALSEFEIGSLIKNETFEEMPLYMLLEMFIHTTDDHIQLEVRKLLKSLLLSTKLFDDPYLELSLWLQSLQILNDDLKMDGLWIFCTATRDLVLAPYHYADLLGQHFSDAIQESVTLGNLGMNLEDLLIGKETAITNQMFLSPLLLAALSALRKAKKRRRSGATKYLSIVAREILHYQYQPEVICHILDLHSDILPSSLMNYLAIWLHSETDATNLDMQCFNKDHDEQELHSLSAALQNAFLSLHTTGSWPTAVLKDTNSFSQMCPAELSSILHQMLLYMHTELQRAQDGYPIDAVTAFIAIIDTMLKQVESSSLKSVDFAEELQDETLFEHFLEVLLCHPTFVNWYLICDEKFNNSRPRDVVENCVPLVTAFISKHLESAIKKVGNNEEIERIANPYKKKVLSILSTSLADQESDEWWMEMQTHFNLFYRFFTREELIEAIEKLLGHQQGGTGNLVTPGKLTFLNGLLQRFCSQLDCSESGGLNADVIQKLLDVIAEYEKSDAEMNLANHFLLLLDKYPLYCFALNPECVPSLLETATTSRVKLVVRLAQYSPGHLYVVRQWLEENCNNLVKWHSSLSVELINVCLLAQSKQVSKNDPLLSFISHVVWNSISTYLIDGSEKDDELWEGLDFSKVLTALLKGNYIDIQSLQDVGKEILTQAQTQTLIPSILHLLRIIQMFDCLKKQHDFCIDGLGCQCVLLQIIVLSISSLLKGEKKLDEQYFVKFLVESLNVVKLVDDDSIEYSFSEKTPTNWAAFIKLCLKHAFQCSLTSTYLFSLLNELCSRLYKVENVHILPSVSEVYQMLLGHSNFLPIMLGELGSVDMKESILDVLLSLSLLDKSVCQTEHFPILLGSYQPTFKSVDQKLLYLMKWYEEQQASMYEFRPFLWGSAAVSHYAVKKSAGLALWKHPKTEDVLGLLDQEKLQKTAFLFPLDLEMEPKSRVENVDSVEIYDPRFLLPLFTHILTPGNLVNCKKLLESKCLGVAFASLASSDPNMRALGYYVLCQFYQHLEGSLYRERFIWLGLLDSIKNSIAVENQRLSSLMTVFLTRVTDLLFAPEDPLYGPIYHFLTLKPFLDLQNVPEFYTLFYSSDLKHRNHREWILTLICDGLRNSLDFHLCQKRFIFNILLTFYSSSMCTHQNKLVILQALKAVCMIPSSAFVLCKQHGLLAWMRTAIVEENNQETLDFLITIMHTLWETGCNANVSRENTDKTTNSEKVLMNGFLDETGTKGAQKTGEKYNFYWSFPMEFLLNCLAMLEKICNNDSTKCLSQYLLTLSNCLSYVQSANRTHSFLTISHVSQLMKIIPRLNSCSGILKSSLNTIGALESEESVQNVDCLIKILLLWHPRQQAEMSEEEGKVKGKLLLQAMQLVLVRQCSIRNPPVTVASWLSDCLREDRTFIWTKMLLANEELSKKCWDLILNTLMWLMVSNSPSNNLNPSLMEISVISDFISALLHIATLVQEGSIRKKNVRKLLKSRDYERLMKSERFLTLFRSFEQQQPVSKRDTQLAATFLLELWMKKSVPNLTQFLAKLQQE